MTESNDKTTLVETWSHFFDAPDVGSYVDGRIRAGEGETVVLVNTGGAIDAS